MKNIFTFLSLFCSFFVNAQNKEILYVRDIECEYDTLTSIHEKSDIAVDENSNLNLTIIDGGKKILYINMFSEKCACNDCKESNQFAIMIDSLQMNVAMPLNKLNMQWVYGNSWIQPKYITAYLGIITQIKESQYELKISELLAGAVIRTIHMVVDTKQ